MNLHEFLDDQEQTENESFKVTNESTANWALRKIKQYQDKQKENNALAESEIAKIEMWLETVNEQAQNNIDYFQGLLAEYALKQRDANPEFKSQKLPNGSIKFGKQQPKYTYDDKALLEYLKKSEETDLIRVKEEPNKSAIKKLFPVQNGKLVNVGTGEVIDGVTVEDREDKFEVITE
jgi:phage host-nuclease inhibitor protein Gam